MSHRKLRDFKRNTPYLCLNYLIYILKFFNIYIFIEPMKKVDLAIAIDWEYDWDFVKILEQMANQLSLSTYIVWSGNFIETCKSLKNGELTFQYIYDRASDTSPHFIGIYDWVIEHSGGTLETWENIKWASDKATMHLEFIANGLNTPYTIILPSFNKEESIYLTLDDLAFLGRPFIIKPANTTGGGIGVVDGAETLHDVLQTRKEFYNDKYLLQEKVIPLEMDGKRFWFRGFYACGLFQCTWWNDLTHIYKELTQDEIQKYDLNSLFEIIQKISEISKINFFSTEIALTDSRKFVVVDYVNESCDMRLQSQAIDGIPNAIVERIAMQICRFIKKQISSSPG